MYQSDTSSHDTTYTTYDYCKKCKIGIDYSNYYGFGSSNRDHFMVTFFSGSKLISSASVIAKSDKIDYTKVYTTLDSGSLKYSCSLYSTNYKISHDALENTASVLLDIRNLTEFGTNIQPGTYEIVVEPLRETVGSPTMQESPAIISEISNTRTELKFVYNSSSLSYINDDFVAYATNKIKIGDIVTYFSEKTSAPEIYTLVTSYTGSMLDVSSSYGMASNIEVIQFIYDIYNGVDVEGSNQFIGLTGKGKIPSIKYHLNNKLLSEMTRVASYSVIRTELFTIYRQILSSTLDKINTAITPTPDVYSLFDSIIFSGILDTALDYAKELDESYNTSHAYGLTIGQETIPILAKKTNGEWTALKLKYSLPADVDIGDKIYISKINLAEAIYQKAILDVLYTKRSIKLAGPNFGARINSIHIGEEKEYSGIILNDYEKTSAIESIDYRDLSNFIVFSSAEIRLKSYLWKLSLLESLRDELSEININLTLRPTDPDYLESFKSIKAEIDDIYNNFDEYERFLYSNPSWVKTHSDLAFEYDKNNKDCLAYNSLPMAILESSDNSDYMKFMAMVGHIFDNIRQYISTITDTFSYENQIRIGTPLKMAISILESNGIKFNGTDDISNVHSNFEFISKRLLANIPLILKTKGTKKSIDAIISCFGIPTNFISIKECGGNKAILGNYINTTVDNIYGVSLSTGSFIEVIGNVADKYCGMEFAFSTSDVKNGTYHLASMNIQQNATASIGLIKSSTDNALNCSIYVDLPKVSAPGQYTRFILNNLPILTNDQVIICLTKDEQTESFIDNTVISGKLHVGINSENAKTYSVPVLFPADLFSVEYLPKIYIGNAYQSNYKLQSIVSILRVYSQPITDLAFESHCRMFGSYNIATSDVIHDLEDISRKLICDFTRPVDTTANDAFDYTIYSKKPLSSACSIILHNIQIKNTRQAKDDCQNTIYVPRFPYGFEQISVNKNGIIYGLAKTGNTRNSIHLKESGLVANLSPTSTSEKNDFATKKSTGKRVEVVMSPTTTRDADLMEFFNSYNLSELFGSGELMYSRQYVAFEKFREKFYGKYFTKIDLQTFIDFAKSVMSSTQISLIKNTIPANSSFIGGVLIEQSILERSKYTYKKPSGENFVLNCSISHPLRVNITVASHSVQNSDEYDNQGNPIPTTTPPSQFGDPNDIW